jgi:hypothetical protein
MATVSITDERATGDNLFNGEFSRVVVLVGSGIPRFLFTAQPQAPAFVLSGF